MYKQFGLWLVMVGMALVMIGCGPRMPKTVKVNGRVTLNGKPVPQGTVSFLPRHGGVESSQPATGDIQPDGSYEMKTFQRGDGVRPGDYSIAVYAPATWGISFTPGVKIKSLIPERYKSPTTSGLTATIEDDRTPVIKNLDLTD